MATVTSSQKATREREELVLRFFAYTDGLDEYRDRVKQFLFLYTEKMNKEFSADPALTDIYRQRLVVVLDFVEQSFTLGFRKSAVAKTTPRARFESIAIGAHEALKIKPDLVVSRERTNFIVNSKAFLDKVTSDGANAKRKLTGRIQVMNDALLEES